MGEFDRPFYTIPEAAELLRVHKNTLYNMVRRKEIEYYKVGNQIRISASELEQFRVPAETSEADKNNAT